MHIKNDLKIYQNLDGFSGWKISDRDKFAAFQLNGKKVIVEIVTLERSHRTVSKIALAVLLTLGTLLIGLLDSRLRNLWSGKEIETIGLYKEKPADLQDCILPLPQKKFTELLSLPENPKQTPNTLEHTEHHTIATSTKLTDKATPLVYALMTTNSTGFLAFDEDIKYTTVNIGHTECHGSARLRNIAKQHALQSPELLSFETLAKVAHLDRTLFTRLLLKRTGHAFNLSDTINLSKGSFQLEGFNETFTIPMQMHRFNQFATEMDLKSDFINWMQSNFLKAIWHENVSEEKIEGLYHAIQQENDNPQIVGSGYDWHSNQIIFSGKQLIICERQGTVRSGVSVYTIEDESKITREFLRDLVNRMSFTRAGNLPNKIFNHPDAYGLKFHDRIPLKTLKAGNCTYTNVKALIFALFNIWEQKQLKDSSQTARQLYKQFVQFDRVKVAKEFAAYRHEICPEVDREKLNMMNKHMQECIERNREKLKTIPLGNGEHLFRNIK